MMVGSGTSGTSEPGWTLEQAFAQIQQLLRAVNTLQQTIAQQDQTITQLQAQSNAPPLAQTQTVRGPKMATLPLYDGSMATCKAFINACRLYISAKPQEFHNLQTKVTWVLGFMQTGMAQMFCNHFMVYMTMPDFHTQYLESMELDPIELLCCNIYKVFRDPNKQVMAIQEITTIKQGTKTGKEHVQLFKQCYMHSVTPSKPLALKCYTLQTSSTQDSIGNGGKQSQKGKPLLFKVEKGMQAKTLSLDPPNLPLNLNNLLDSLIPWLETLGKQGI
ncbi:hypothetical protein AMATHDRAFT_2590 [Amanita thiersii Skay4041]|uniref:Retrotransposon gag domain-containing protein n=1 Tax=Amanita thiersii Skay4041 TaxID=703135 RepID=A0A2A9NW06_9AGAR|nr:hypothetical protein AMATHDRAFT_2590 [Amanita thiersii Skay4041]